MNDKITAFAAKEISLENLNKKRSVDTDHLEEYICSKIVKQANRGCYYAKFCPQKYAQHNEISTFAVDSSFRKDVRPRLEARGFVIVWISDIFNDGYNEFLIRWDKQF